MLASSDLLLIGYNFDAQSIAYVRYSIDNKLADYLNAGAPVLLIGPRDIETISFCESRAIGHVCTENSATAVKSAIAGLMNLHPAEREELVARSHTSYAEFCNSDVSPQMFRAHLTNAAFSIASGETGPVSLQSKLKFIYRTARLGIRSRLPAVRRFI